MSTSGVKHFTEKYGTVKRQRSGIMVRKKEEDELNIRMAVPYKTCKSTRFARSTLKKIKAVYRDDHRRLCRYIRASKSPERTVEANHNHQMRYTQALESKQIGEQIPSPSIKRSAADNGNSERPTKRQKISESETSGIDLNEETRRLERVTKNLEKLNSLSRRYNGPEGFIIPPMELRLYNQKMDSEKSEQSSTTFKEGICGPLSLPNLREMYLKKLDERTSLTIRNWTTPTAKPRPCLPQEERPPGLYGTHQQNARDFILTAIQQRMTKNDILFLTDLILKANDEDLEALALRIESYEMSIDNEVKSYNSHQTYTQAEIEYLRPQIRDFNELDIIQNSAEKRKWSAWTFAKKVAGLAKEVVGLKIDIAKVVREIEGRCGPTDFLLPEEARPLKAIPLHIRALHRRRAEDEDYSVGGFGNIAPLKRYTLESHARSVGRSKLSNVVASAEKVD